MSEQKQEQKQEQKHERAGKADWRALTDGVTFHTSRWSNPALKDAGKTHLIVGVCNGEPKWPLGFSHMSEKRLAPDWATMGKPFPIFRKAYRAKLHGMGDELRGIFTALAREARANGKVAVVMLCYEDVRETVMPSGAGSAEREPHGDWCHRTLLAEFMDVEWGLHLSEMGDPTPLPSEKKSGKKKVKPAGVESGASAASAAEQPKRRLSRRERQDVETQARSALPDELRAKVWNGDAKVKSDVMGNVFVQEGLF